MTDKTERLSVQLNEAFARLEQAQDSPEPGGGAHERKPEKPQRSNNIDQPANSGTGNILGVVTGLIAIGIASFAAFSAYQLKNSQPVEAVTRAQVDGEFARLRLELEQYRQASDSAQTSTRRQMEELSTEQQVAVQQFNLQLDDAKLAFDHSAFLTAKRFVRSQDTGSGIAMQPTATISMRHKQSELFG